MMVAWMFAYFATGAFVGFLAGLLGIGGGMTLVPVLAAMFTAQQLTPDHTVHLALGTGMASMVRRQLCFTRCCARSNSGANVTSVAPSTRRKEMLSLA